MRLHATEEKAFAEMLEAGDEPFIVVMNPGKRKKFLKHEGGVYNAEAIADTLDKILGGDARFKAIKGNTLPDLVS